MTTIPSQVHRPPSPRGALILLATALAFGLGTACGQLLEERVVVPALTGAALVLAAAAGIGLVPGAHPRLGSRIRVIALLSSVLATGFLNGALFGPVLGPVVRETDDALVLGRVRKVEHLHWGRRILVDLSQIDEDPVSVGARLILPHSAAGLRSGDEIRGIARLAPPEGPKNPGGFDSAAALAQQQVQAVGRLHRVTRTASGPLDRRRRFDIARDGVRAAAGRIAGRVVDEEEPRQELEGILRALSLGESQAVPPEVRRNFATAGLAHLLAISGLHIGLVAAGLFALIRRILLYLPWARQAGPMAAIVVAPVVGVLVAWVAHPASAARAGLMALILLSAVVLQRRLCAWSSLSAVAVALLVLQPGLALRPGFQLSFAAVAGLLAMVAREAAPEAGASRLRKMGRRLKLMGEVTWAAALATAPLCAVHFGLVPLLGNAANLVAVPLTGLLVPCVAVAATATLVLGEGADSLWLVPAALAQVLLVVARGAASLPLASASVPFPGLLALLASGTGLWWSTRRGPGWKRLAAASLVILPLLLSGLLDRGSPPAAPLEVVFLSVGHGDATLIRTARGDVLVDGGRGPVSGIDAGRAHVVPALRALGVRRLSAVIATHPHDDHYGGLTAVVESFPTEALFHSGLGSDDDGPYAALLARASRSGASIHIACLDPLPNLHPVTIRCLHPRWGEEDHLSRLSTNDKSLVLLVELGERRLLLPGDIEAGAEEMLVAGRSELAADVVKAPHHGSRTSSTPALIAATGASHVVFSSASPSPRFDFPAPEVVDRWRESGAAVWWTHHHGAIRFLTDGESLRIIPFRERASAWPDRKPVRVADSRTSTQSGQ